MDDDEAEQRDVWRRVDAELARRAGRHLTPGDWGSLASTLRLTRQTKWNWKHRQRIPQTSYREVADALGWGEFQSRPHDIEQSTRRKRAT